MDERRVRVLGVRHHGPGSARAVVRALEAYQPDVVLIEGPPEADSLVRFVGHADLCPPVALLAYDPAAPSRAAFWPFAVFSPEWQALAWAARHQVPVRFMDLPAAISLATDKEKDSSTRSQTGESSPQNEPVSVSEPVEDERDISSTSSETGGDVSSTRSETGGDVSSTRSETGQPSSETEIGDDPIAILAATAGYDDAERWWDDVIEARTDGDPFDALTEAMGELRAAAARRRSPDEQSEEERREAHMRQVLRAALRENNRRIAVVCGAWHAPALTEPLPPATHDQEILRGLAKRKVTMTWVPWTHSRLAFRSGYGAGVDSPGWYHHLFTAPDAVIERWLTHVAGVLREHDLPVSSAHVIESVRLADTLANLRGRPMPGLDELQEATLAVMCGGEPLVLSWVTRDAVIGEELGTVPDDAPSVPLEADLKATAKSVRLPIKPDGKAYTLDLRKDIDRGKSKLLHRLAVLGIPWGDPLDVSGTGTFKEGWVVAWEPEFAVNVIEASLWGTTVEAAATAKLLDAPGSLGDVTGRVEQALLAELPDALPPLLAALDARAAHEADIAALMAALPALVRAQRYGTVRGTDTTMLGTVAEAMLARVCAGLGAALGGLSDEAATPLRVILDELHSVIGLLPEASREEWFQTLGTVIERSDVPGLLAGRIVRLLLDADRLPVDDATDRLSRALSYGATPAQKAAWAEGFLSGGATLLIYDEEVLGVVDTWVNGLDEDDFVAVLPMLRRAFGSYSPSERRAIAERTALLGSGSGTRVATTAGIELEHAADVLATVRLLLRGAP